MLLLAIDTSANFSSVAVYDSTKSAVLTQDQRDIGRGHAEIVMEQIHNCLDDASASYSDLGRIGVVKGPGNFTGVRVGLAVARGLALSLKIPAIGISNLHACEELAWRSGFEGKLLTIMDARREQAYYKFSGAEDASIGTYQTLGDELTEKVDGICGSGADNLEKLLKSSLPILHTEHIARIEIVAGLAAVADPDENPAEPLYLRSADAKSQTGFALAMA